MAGEKTERFRVLVMDDYEGQAALVPAYERLMARADVAIQRSRLAAEGELARALEGVHALLLMRERSRFGERELSLAPALRLISQTGRGVAHLDLPAATRRGIAVAVTANESGVSTVELTWGLILALLRHIPEIDRRMRLEAWPAVVGNVLEGKTLGIIGLGRIGKEIARIAHAFRTRLLAAGKSLTDERAAQAGAKRVSLETLLRESDIVTIHVALKEESRGLIGEKELALMKPGAILVNTARGPLVSEAALVRALESGRLGGAGLDVYDEEPLPLDHPLRRLNNVVLLSHRGYAAEEILRGRYELAMENILAFMEGRPANLLNPEVWAGKPR